MMAMTQLASFLVVVLAAHSPSAACADTIGGAAKPHIIFVLVVRRYAAVLLLLS